MRDKLTLKELGLKFKEIKTDKTFTELFNRVKPNLLSYIYNIVKDEDRAEDIFSITMSIVYNKLDQYNPKYNISTWIYKIAYNCSLMDIRYANRKNSSTFSSLEYNPRSLDKLEEKFSSVENDFEFKEEQKLKEDKIKETYNTIIQIMEDIGDDCKDILIDKFVHDLKYDDIAKKYDLPIHTVRNWINRGRKKVQQKLKELNIHD